jgi:two-component system nitrogen regulation response regulator GlnG
MTRAEREMGMTRRISQPARNILRVFPWPGNVRQLENVLKRLLVTSSEPDIGAAELESVLGGPQAAEPARAGAVENEKLSQSVARHLKRYFDLHNGQLPPAGVYDRILREIELPLIEIALDATAGNQAKCADLLGINRNTLRKKITDLDIRVTRRRKLM